MRAATRWLFGAHGQVAIGALACALAIAAWVYGATLHGDALIRWLFHVSMFALLLAAYAIVATGLGYKATERVEAQVANVEHADEVSIED